MIGHLANEFTLYMPDMLGYGESERPYKRYSVPRLADGLTGFLDTLALDRVDMIGHSLGGKIVLELARRNPERVDRLVLVSPMGFGRLSVPGMILGTSAWIFFQLTQITPPYPILDIRLSDPDLKSLPQVTTPTMVVWGRWDLFFPWTYAERVRRAIQGTKVEILRWQAMLHTNLRTNGLPKWFWNF